MSIIINKEIRVAHVLSSSQVVLNIGDCDGISLNNEYIVYGLSKDAIIDPSTGENLGYLELYRGTGVVTYIQDTMCILTAMPSNPLARLQLVTGELSGTFKNPQVGDYVKPNATKIQSTKKS